MYKRLQNVDKSVYRYYLTDSKPLNTYSKQRQERQTKMATTTEDHTVTLTVAVYDNTRTMFFKEFDLHLSRDTDHKLFQKEISTHLLATGKHRPQRYYQNAAEVVAACIAEHDDEDEEEMDSTAYEYMCGNGKEIMRSLLKYGYFVANALDKHYALCIALDHTPFTYYSKYTPPQEVGWADSMFDALKTELDRMRSERTVSATEYDEQLEFLQQYYITNTYPLTKSMFQEIVIESKLELGRQQIDADDLRTILVERGYIVPWCGIDFVSLLIDLGCTYTSLYNCYA